MPSTSHAKTVITSLPKPEALAATAAAIAKAHLPRRVIVEASTFTIDDKARAQAVLHKADHLLLDCPVSGTGAQAKVEASSSMLRAAPPRSSGCARCLPPSAAACSTSANSAMAAA
jgi:3-hydroxyisobutyrate dehydrogenase-like beta-hydroxyacid dehydrogenase